MVRIQLRMRDLVVAAAAERQPLPPRYWTLLWRGVAPAIPAFFALVIVVYLIMAKLP